jgi:uncharacterized membrane protein
MHPWTLAGTAFAASAVEFVEAATIVLAVGITHGWRSALTGTAIAIAALALIVGIGAPLLTNAISIERLELIVGPFLILFGIAWLRKAIWRYAGRKAMHDETAIFERELSSLRSRTSREGTAVAFQGVFVEGLEVAVIVVTFAATAPALVAWTIGGAAAALAIVLVAAIALRAPFARVPENALKAIVGVMLLSLGTLWTGEGLHISWWYGDATLAGFVLCTAAVAAILTVIRRARASNAV